MEVQNFDLNVCLTIALPSRSPIRPPNESILNWVAGWGSGPVPPRKWADRPIFKQTLDSRPSLNRPRFMSQLDEKFPGARAKH